MLCALDAASSCSCPGTARHSQLELAATTSVHGAAARTFLAQPLQAKKPPQRAVGQLAALGHAQLRQLGRVQQLDGGSGEVAEAATRRGPLRGMSARQAAGGPNRLSACLHLAFNQRQPGRRTHLPPQCPNIHHPKAVHHRSPHLRLVRRGATMRSRAARPASSSRTSSRGWDSAAQSCDTWGPTRPPARTRRVRPGRCPPSASSSARSYPPFSSSKDSSWLHGRQGRSSCLLLPDSFQLLSQAGGSRAGPASHAREC